ncbi:MAG: adenylate cyclase [uncultured archaeon A07HR60]|nr:MAG: adenylate cyclase [uncultured archaeon A07HR60]
MNSRFALKKYGSVSPLFTAVDGGFVSGRSQRVAGLHRQTTHADHSVCRRAGGTTTIVVRTNDDTMTRAPTEGHVYEVELKIEADHDAVQSQLESVGAQRLAEVEQTDTYFDAPSRSFADTDEALRLRREKTGVADDSESSDSAAATRDDGGDTQSAGHTVTEEIRITYKGPLVDNESKTREEFETTVGDQDEAGAILEGLGYTPAATVHKRRRHYQLDGYTVTLDDVSEVGQYVEVEQEAPEDRISEVKAGAKEVVRQLDLNPDDQIQTSYLGMKLD